MPKHPAFLVSFEERASRGKDELLSCRLNLVSLNSLDFKMGQFLKITLNSSFFPFILLSQTLA